MPRMTDEAIRPAPPKPHGILLHTCCAWCLLDVLDTFRADYGRVAVAFYNPNIHPREEFEKRLKSVRLLCERLGLELHADEQYGLAPFLSALYNVPGFDPAADRPRRCARCYALRMGRTARRAEGLGFAAFSTTLLSSPHQLQDTLRAEGLRAAGGTGIHFDGRDLQALHGSARDKLPNRLLLHRQHYCGCVFSEAERTGAGEVRSEETQ
jgi:predicted adenine nucleotide alpha hydrolase (AANH) superfamily ATPase